MDSMSRVCITTKDNFCITTKDNFCITTKNISAHVTPLFQIGDTICMTLNHQCQRHFGAPMPLYRSPKAVFIFINLKYYIIYFRHIVKFRKKVGYFPNIATPKLYHEKLLWRKIFDKNPHFYVFSDKLKCKEFIKDKNIGLKFAKIRWVGAQIDQAIFEKLKGHVIIKANKGSGYNLFPKDQKLGYDYVSGITKKWLKKDYGANKLERSYSRAENVLFAENIISPDKKITDFYIRACDGDIILITSFENPKIDNKIISYYDINGNRLYQYEKKDKLEYYHEKSYEPPKTFKKAIEAAKILSVGIDFIRCDFMTDGKNLYAGEVTVYPDSGLTKHISNPEIDINSIVNKKWDLLKSYFFKENHSGFIKIYRDHLESALLSQIDSTTRL